MLLREVPGTTKKRLIRVPETDISRNTEKNRRLPRIAAVFCCGGDGFLIGIGLVGVVFSDVMGKTSPRDSDILPQYGVVFSSVMGKTSPRVYEILPHRPAK